MELYPLLDRWLNALESGKYTQCRKNLSEGPGIFCALGLAYEVWDESSWYTAKSSRFRVPTANLFDDRNFQRLFGLPEEVFAVVREMNDTGYTFKQIANYIRANSSQLRDESSDAAASLLGDLDQELDDLLDQTQSICTPA